MTGPAVPAAAAPVQGGCAVPDARLEELSGLVADGPVWWAIADGGRQARAISLDPSDCASTGVRSAPIDPADVEDLALGPDGALWLADIGDNGGRRQSVATIVLPRSGPPRLHRMTYPDGPRDAEALVVGDDGVPVLVTKSTGAAAVYRPSGPLTSGDGPAPDVPTPMVRVGEVVLPESATTGGPLGSLGARTVTGAGLSPAGADGRVVALRTYTDAWLFRLPGGGRADADAVVRALSGPAVQVPLPDEPQGEAVALTADGTLLSGTESRDGRPAAVRVLPGAVASALAPDAPAVTQPVSAPEAGSDSGTGAAPMSPAVLGAVVVGVALAALAAAMTVHSRRRHPRRRR